jgi:hypothetical protein
MYFTADVPQSGTSEWSNVYIVQTCDFEFTCLQLAGVMCGALTAVLLHRRLLELLQMHSQGCTAGDGRCPVPRCDQLRNMPPPGHPGAGGAHSTMALPDGRIPNEPPITSTCKHCVTGLQDKEIFRCTVCRDFHLCRQCRDRSEHSHHVLEVFPSFQVLE